MTVQEKYKDSIKLIFEYAPFGVWKYIVLQTDPWYEKYAKSMSIGWYLQHSWFKTLSPFFEIASAEYDLDPVAVDPEELYEAVGTTIRDKFYVKWNKLYEALFTAEYNVLDDNSYSTVKTGNDTDTTTYDITDTKEGNNTDTTTHDVTVIDDGKTGTNETVTRNTENSSDVYGFNSSAPVGDTYDNNVTSETTVGDADSNTQYNKNTKTGTESKTFGIDETAKKQGTETKTFGVNETVTKSGRNVSGADLIDTEVEMRNKQIFFDIVYRDVDSILTLSIY